MDGKVSIVIPCFNQGETLIDTLESVEKYRNSNLAEVIIVNDGSTDSGTCRVLEELVRSPYTIIHQVNRGLGAARNAGIQVAKGEFVLPLDSDNRIRETYLNDGVKLLLENPEVGVIYGDAEYFGERTGRWRVPDFDFRQLVKSSYIDACALFRRSAWVSVNGYDEKMPWMGQEDWDFWIRIAASGWHFMHLSDIAFEYRVRRGSMVEDARRHGAEIAAHIFKKPENRILQIVRDQERQLEQLLRIPISVDYRVGHLLLCPVRKLKRLLRAIH